MSSSIKIGRRAFLGAASAALAPPSVAAVIRLWPGMPPGGGGPAGSAHVGNGGAISGIAMPTLTVFRPRQASGAAMLVAAGGGYRRIAMAREAYPAAAWLNARGITAFVLCYRLPPEGWTNGPLAPLQDAQRALRIIRAQAPRYRLDPDRIGVLGFSAGGHLMGLTASRSAFRSYAVVDAQDGLSARPDNAALVYPVVTLEAPYDRTSTRYALVGPHPTPEASAAWSVQTHVRQDCPPVFLMQAEDDPISDPANTLIMEAACRAAGVAVDLHRVPTGGHGFGMGRPGSLTAAWPSWYETWLRARHVIT